VFRTEWTRRPARWLLRAWSWTGRKYGWHYQVMESWGPLLAPGYLLTNRLPDGSLVECDLRDHVQRQMFFQGTYEPVDAYLFTRLATTGSTVIDAGANVGQYTLLASTCVGPQGQVHSFEPIPATFDRLRRHVQRNGIGNVRLEQAALWDEPGELELGLAADLPGNCGSYSVGQTGGAVRCRAMRLDDYLAQQGVGRVDLVKMDIEGAEPRALRGMNATLGRDRPMLMLEANREACARLGDGLAELWSLLAGFGYRAWAAGRRSSEWRELRDPSGVVQQNVYAFPGVPPAALTGGWDVRDAIRWARRGA
jgi:FkbM family methyltransferase